MKTKLLLPEETVLSQSDDESITLTTHRIQDNRSETGEGYFVSIMLEKISSIELRSKSWVLVLTAGIISLAAGFLLELKEQGAFIPGIVIGGVCILLYFLTKKQVITICSDGGVKINSNVNGMKREAALDFINKIEEAKLRRSERVLI